MAKCPKCKKDVRYDFNQDGFWDQDEERFFGEEVVLDNAEFEIRVVRCSCREVLAIWYVNEDQVTVFNHAEWAGIEWDLPENCTK